MSFLRSVPIPFTNSGPGAQTDHGTGYGEGQINPNSGEINRTGQAVNPYNLDPTLFEEFANSSSATGNISAARATLTGPEGPGGPPVYSQVIDAYRNYVKSKQANAATASAYIAQKQTHPGRDQTIITEQSNQSTLLGTPKTRTLLG